MNTKIWNRMFSEPVLQLVKETLELLEAGCTHTAETSDEPTLSEEATEAQNAVHSTITILDRFIKQDQPDIVDQSIMLATYDGFVTRSPTTDPAFLPAPNTPDATKCIPVERLDS